MTERSDATAMGGEEAAHFCMVPTPEEVESWRQHWRKQHDQAHPKLPPPPMRNAALALDLAGDGVREFSFQGTVYRFEPTSVAAGLELQQVQERLGNLAAIEQLTGQEELVALRACYATIAQLGWDHLIPHPPVNPFAEGEQSELHLLFAFLISPGTEPGPDSDGPTARWNAAHHLMAYEATFGPATTWRRFLAGLGCLRRLEAERAIQMHGAVWSAISAAFGGEEQRQAWLGAQRTDAR